MHGLGSQGSKDIHPNHFVQNINIFIPTGPDVVSWIVVRSSHGVVSWTDSVGAKRGVVSCKVVCLASVSISRNSVVSSLDILSVVAAVGNIP